MKSSIYGESIRDGSQDEDLLIGYAVGERYVDFLYMEPYTHELAYIAETVPDSGSVGKDKIAWVLDRSVRETGKLLNLLRDTVREILKGNTYKKSIDA
jgi:hypothetical protein